MRDVNRIGFTQLLGGDNARSGPIVFVHGLRGHPRYTWENDRAGGGETDVSTSSKRKTFKSFLRAKPSTPTTDTNTYEGSSALRRLFWPDEYLTHDIPEARVWTYGYNADAIGGLFQANNKNSVSQHGRDLAVRIEREIENEDPILFVAHSLGGIIVKDAIHRSDVCRSRTKLVVFLGTPHRGSSYAGWGEIAANLARLALHDSNKKIIETMEVNSEVLDNIHEEFKTIVPEYSIKVHSFQEARGILGIKGLDNKVVDDFSSKLDLPRGLETVESIDANHMQMARCSDTSDPQYRAVVGVLKQFMRSGKSSGALTSSTLKSVQMSTAHPLTPFLIYPSGDRLRTNVNSRLVALETSQEIMGAQCDRMSIILTELRNTTLSTVHLQESYTIGSECEFLCSIISFSFKV
ncbi:hypothetical protein K458DRAFT_323244 [Lentithecium fluviatile CBS 122367]|uniref:DUF676 domain-containing protein n=1 Tax=Lentithecium fluviatile CBS 122367 TaxID=1168545 RepID=A0A6G1ICH3_9PLEO|nr:hypothetical protein K458DRAFT_323244 [Lentithecium fluviatile CBS 122367]